MEPCGSMTVKYVHLGDSESVESESVEISDEEEDIMSD